MENRDPGGAGAPLRRIASPVVTESLLVSLLGGTLGIAFTAMVVETLLMSEMTKQVVLSELAERCGLIVVGDYLETILTTRGLLYTPPTSWPSSCADFGGVAASLLW